MNTESLRQLIEDSGFDPIGTFDPADLIARSEVREMCAMGKCQAYGHSWSCPPALGELDIAREKFKSYRHGLLFQTVGETENSFDWDAMMDAAKQHHQRFDELDERLAAHQSELLLLSAGTCKLCPECSYPDEPCRFPERMHPSMEAMGLIVADVCKLADVPYNHGPNTIAYTSCVLY
ncbi:MAG: DUF2284 domain-containing protein [Actinomycetia bacterium]|nr:DUF2284 domain-containing protein [Actinomycetes bacterium]